MSDFAKEAAPDATGKCGELVTVKPLEWNPFRAETPFGYYSVDDQTDRDEKELRGRPPFLLSGSRVDLQRFWTLEEARAAAQAHFNARVLSLVTRSQAVELLAAERAEKEELDAECRVLAKRCIEKDARIKELEWKAHNAALSNKIGEDSAPMLWSEYAEALEADNAAKDETIRRQDIALRGALLEVERLKADNAAKDAEREAIMQAITDPENQPSKFGTVTIAFFNEKIAAKNARIKALEQVNAKLCDDVIDYELKIADRDVSLNELKQKLADKFSFTSDDDALAVLERYGHKETGNGIIKADMRALDDMCRAAVAYLCAEWDFVFQDEVELNRETLGAKLAAAEKVKEAMRKAAVDYCWQRYKSRPPMDLKDPAVFTSHEWEKIGEAMDAAARAVLGGKLL